MKLVLTARVEDVSFSANDWELENDDYGQESYIRRDEVAPILNGLFSDIINHDDVLDIEVAMTLFRERIIDDKVIFGYMTEGSWNFVESLFYKVIVKMSLE